MESSEPNKPPHRHRSSKHRVKTEPAEAPAPEEQQEPVPEAFAQPEPLSLPNLVFQRKTESLKASMQELRGLWTELAAAQQEIEQAVAAVAPTAGNELARAASRRLDACLKHCLALQHAYKQDLEALTRLENGLVSQVLELNQRLTHTQQQAVRQGFGRSAVFDYRVAPDDHASQQKGPFN